MLSYILFYWYILTGTVLPQDNTGRDTYILKLDNGQVIEHAYQEEVIAWINTGSFKYNEDL